GFEPRSKGPKPSMLTTTLRPHSVFIKVLEIFLISKTPEKHNNVFLYGFRRKPQKPKFLYDFAYF
ncbi:MAG: hypothetical protein KJ597_00065, partial [Nanoarchaeota archaeon]|nr:hypothetical protein [Nanoarchaeota archaeon]